MPVLVTGVETAVGRLTVERLVRAGGEVRVFLDLEHPAPVDPDTFRRLGCKVAQGALDDEGHLETALEQVHTLLHLGPDPTEEADRVVEVAATVVSAAVGAGVRRLVVRSDTAVAAGPAGAPNGWLAALEEVEDLAADAPGESVVLRTSLAYGPRDPLTTALLTGAAGGAGRHWPVWAGDVAAVAAAVDRDRGADGELHLVVEVTGPDELSPDALAAALGPHRVDLTVPTGVPRSRAARARAAVPGHVADLLARDVPRPAGAIGAHGTSLADALATLRG